MLGGGALLAVEALVAPKGYCGMAVGAALSKLELESVQLNNKGLYLVVSGRGLYVRLAVRAVSGSCPTHPRGSARVTPPLGIPRTACAPWCVALIPSRVRRQLDTYRCLVQAHTYNVSISLRSVTLLGLCEIWRPV